MALYFACICEEEPKCDGAIWSFERTYQIPELDVLTITDPFKIEGVRIVQPFYPSPKMTAQSGLFTIHENPLEDFAKVKHRTVITDILKGQKWLVRKDAKPAILGELMRLGISARTLFPDLTGLARANRN